MTVSVTRTVTVSVTESVTTSVTEHPYQPTNQYYLPRGVWGGLLKTPNGKEGMLKTSTMDLRMRDLMRAPSIHADRCVVCGRRYPLNEHHIVYRSAGNIFDEDGNPVPKPTITLCGMGNVLRGSDGRYFCHGKAHNGRLHFRMGEWELEYLETEDTISYSDALERDGWTPVSQAHWRRIWIGNR